MDLLISQAHSRPELTDSIAMALSRVDSPAVLEFFVQQENQSNTNGIWFVTDTWDDRWGTHRRFLSSESLRRMRELWQDTSLTDGARRLAFRYWETHPEGDDPALLGQVTAAEPFYIDAIQRRIKRGDPSVVSDLLPLLEKHTFLWQEAPRIWCPALKEGAKTLAARIEAPETGDADDMPTDAFLLLQVLKDVPQSDAEEILVENWARLGQFAMFLPLALWVGTARCLELVESEIHRLPVSVRVFEHLSFALSVWPPEGGEDKARPQVLRFLRNILPYWNRIDGPRAVSAPRPARKPRPKKVRPTASLATPDPTVEEIMEAADTMESRHLIEAALRVRASDWAREHLYPAITDEQRSAFFPSDEDLMADLDETLERERRFIRPHYALGAIYNYFSVNERNGVSKERLLSVLLDWAPRHPDSARFQMASAAVQEHGSRRDAEVLEGHFAQSNLTDEEKNKSNPTSPTPNLWSRAAASNKSIWLVPFLLAF